MPNYLKKILLVDDDPADRALFTREIRNMGYEVMPTDSPDEAMVAIVGGLVGCLITDQSMPVSGHELVKVAREARIDMGVIILSGSLTPSEPLPPGAAFVNKDDKAALEKALTGCMEHWRIEQGE